MLLKSLRCVLILAGAAALPLYGQTPPANETMPTNPSTSTTTTATKPVHGKKAKADATTTTTTTTASTSTKTKTMPAKHHRVRHTGMSGSQHAYAERLAALLTDVQDKASLTPASWKSISGEAWRLASRLRGKDGAEARKHVREMREAAMKGDADGARSHASMALPYVMKLI